MCNLLVFEEFGRGGRAIKDIAVGDIVLEIPQHLIICEDTVLNTSMVSCLLWITIFKCNNFQSSL
mgnify:CR=1 FL=1